ncbi:hypothetical protein HMPREF1257_01990, partial [Corynebacterium sp. KPL1814]
MCAEETTGLIHHSDHGSQYVSVVYNERLAQHGIDASTGECLMVCVWEPNPHKEMNQNDYYGETRSG